MNYFAVYKTIWSFHKKHSKIGDSPEFWEAVDKEAHEILDRYGHAKFVADLLVAIVIELERVAGKKEKENEHGNIV